MPVMHREEFQNLPGRLAKRIAALTKARNMKEVLECATRIVGERKAIVDGGQEKIQTMVREAICDVFVQQARRMKLSDLLPLIAQLMDLVEQDCLDEEVLVSTFHGAVHAAVEAAFEDVQSGHQPCWQDATRCCVNLKALGSHSMFSEIAWDGWMQLIHKISQAARHALVEQLALILRLGFKMLEPYPAHSPNFTVLLREWLPERLAQLAADSVRPAAPHVDEVEVPSPSSINRSRLPSASSSHASSPWNVRPSRSESSMRQQVSSAQCIRRAGWWVDTLRIVMAFGLLERARLLEVCRTLEACFRRENVQILHWQDMAAIDQYQPVYSRQLGSLLMDRPNTLRFCPHRHLIVYGCHDAGPYASTLFEVSVRADWPNGLPSVSVSPAGTPDRSSRSVTTGDRNPTPAPGRRSRSVTTRDRRPRINRAATPTA